MENPDGELDDVTGPSPEGVSKNIQEMETYIRTEFQEDWDVTTRFSEALEPNRVRIQLIKGTLQDVVISRIRDESGAQYESNLSVIKAWFDARPQLDFHLKNDLFYGFGLILISKRGWEEEKKRLDQVDMQRIHHEEDFFTAYDQLIALVPRASLEEWSDLQARLMALREECYQRSLLSEYTRLQECAQTFYGERISLQKNSRRKIPLVTEKIAIYLRNRLMETAECQFTGRYSSTENHSTNYRKASELLIDLGKGFGVTLPSWLRTKK